ncbi:MAG: hypothetical protein IKS47_04075 [Bacteroidales bacterium]|nr:hypothetical protein [Bacteroidales bacterium]
MEITLFSKCIKDLIAENDTVEVPYLGTFSAELLPAAYSDRQNTIHPPYRKMSFHKHDVSLETGRMLLEKVVEETGVSMDQARVELGWCLSRLCSELEGSKFCKLPGLGVMRANARNEFYFVPDDDLDIWPDGLGLEPVSIRVSETAETPEPEAKPEPTVASQPQPQPPLPAWTDHSSRPEPRIAPFRVILGILIVLLVLFIIASYVFTDEMSPILDRILYTREELRLLGK